MKKVISYVRKEYEPTVCAYMAGIMDGEGSFYIGNFSRGKKTQNPHYQVVLSVTSTDEVLIEWLFSNFGGFKGAYTKAQTPKNSLKKIYRWQCTGERLEHICEIMYPYLVIKKEQAKICLEIRKTFSTSIKKGNKGPVPRLTKDVLDLRFHFFTSLRALHTRSYSPKKDD